MNVQLIMTYRCSPSEGASVSDSSVTCLDLVFPRVLGLGAGVDPSDCAGRVPFFMGLGLGRGLPNVFVPASCGTAAERSARAGAVSRGSGVAAFRLRAGILLIARSAARNDSLSEMRSATWRPAFRTTPTRRPGIELCD